MTDTSSNGSGNTKARERWSLTREKILMVAGLLIIFYEGVFAERLGGVFHIEVLLGGLALCGVSITQWGDKK